MILIFGFDGPFASKPAPTGDRVQMWERACPRRGQSRQSINQVAGRMHLINESSEYPNRGASASARAIRPAMSRS
ncbi:hypothetical protein C1X64_14190 [Pseudomonas sp. GW456-E7]|nr:hypothetical protein C1X64_14190 [Pseudomonas sp. GW456-E7]